MKEMWRHFLFLLSWGWVSAVQLTCEDPGLVCSCELANVVSFTAVHARNSSGQWNTDVAVERGPCSVDKPTGTTTEIISIEKEKPPSAGYEFFPSIGSYLKHHTVTRTWEEARYICEQEGAHLAIINSEEEARTLQEIYKRTPSITNTRYNDFAFLGYHDQYDEGNYITIFGEPLPTIGFNRYYAGGEPNQYGISDIYAGEDCGAVHRNGGLDDLNCDYFHSFFCEKELWPYPPPGPVDYSAGAYRSLQMEKKPRNGTVLRKYPGPGYELFENIGFYKLHTTRATWEDARQICHSEGGHLAIINSELEALVIVALFRTVPTLRQVRDNNLAFIGFHDIYVEGDFRTIYGEPLAMQGYSKWRPSNPDNYAKSTIYPGQDCGAIDRNGLLDDVDCEYYYAFFCEQELYV